MSHYPIQRASESQLDEVYQLLRALARETADERALHSRPSDLQRHFKAGHFRALLAKNPQQHAVGLCLYFLQFSSWRGALGLYIQDLYVTPETRGSGLGQRLIQAALDDHRDEQISHVRLMVDEHNHAGQAFYRHLGFQHSSSEHIYVRELDRS